MPFDQSRSSILPPTSLDDEKVGGGGDKKSENDCPEERGTHNLRERELEEEGGKGLFQQYRFLITQ